MADELDVPWARGIYDMFGPLNTTVAPESDDPRAIALAAFLSKQAAEERERRKREYDEAHGGEELEVRLRNRRYWETLEQITEEIAQKYPLMRPEPETVKTSGRTGWSGPIMGPGGEISAFNYETQELKQLRPANEPSSANTASRPGTAKLSLIDAQMVKDYNQEIASFIRQANQAVLPADRENALKEAGILKYKRDELLKQADQMAQPGYREAWDRLTRGSVFDDLNESAAPVAATSLIGNNFIGAPGGENFFQSDRRFGSSPFEQGLKMGSAMTLPEPWFTPPAKQTPASSRYKIRLKQ